MIGMLLNDTECNELNFMIRKELDEMLVDLQDERLDHTLKIAIRARYKLVFRLFARFANQRELSRYALLNKKT
jgi:hypothetical protein